MSIATTIAYSMHEAAMRFSADAGHVVRWVLAERLLICGEMRES